MNTLGTEIKADSATCSSGCAQYYCCTDGTCSGNSNPNAVMSPMFVVFDAQGTLLQSVGSALSDLVSSVPKALDQAEDIMRNQAIESKNLVVFIVYAILMIVLLGYAASAYFKHKLGTQFMIFISEIIVVVLTISCGLCMFLVTILGDFCMDPSGNVIDLVTETTNNTDFKNLLNYYLNCIGTSPIGSDLDDGILALNYVIGNITTNDAYIGNGGNDDTLCRTEMDSIKAQSQQSLTTLQSLLDFFGCSAVNNAWSQIVNEGLCTKGYSGFYALWISLYLVSFCLFFLMCVAAILFKQYEYQVEGHNEDGEITFDDNDQTFLDNPGVQMVQNPDGTVQPLDPQQGENFDNVYYGKAV